MTGDIEKAACGVAVALFLHGCMTMPREVDNKAVADAIMRSNGYKYVCKDNGKWYGGKDCEWVKPSIEGDEK